MALTNKHRTARAKKKEKVYIPTPFPKVINPHAFDDSCIEGNSTCLKCGQGQAHRLHIRPHVFSQNYSSKLNRCMCGLSEDHFIHRKLS